VKIQPDRFRTMREPNREIDNDQKKRESQAKPPSPEDGPFDTPCELDKSGGREPTVG
jgi:hypothetical protein